MRCVICRAVGAEPALFLAFVITISIGTLFLFTFLWNMVLSCHGVIMLAAKSTHTDLVYCSFAYDFLPESQFFFFFKCLKGDLRYSSTL